MNLLTSIMGMMSQQGAAGAAAAGQAADGAGDAPGSGMTAPPLELDAAGWLPESASVTSSGVDWLFYGVLILSVICFVGIAAAVVYFTIKYRARPGHKAQPSPSHNDPLEITWTVIPSIICVFLFVYGWRGYAENVAPPPNAVEIQVKGMKWKWEFTHFNGVKDDVLHVPKDRSVRLVMNSNDVLHSFFVPAFRIKQDVLPHRYTQLWFKATQAGTYRIYCTEYCGLDHAQMKTTVVVHETEQEYKEYLQARYEQSMNMSPLERGEMVFKNYCIACHTVDGTPRVGPTFKGLYGSQSPLTDGSTVAVDENYVRESILDPQVKIRQGYPPSMTPFKGILSDDDITGVIEYLKSLK